MDFFDSKPHELSYKLGETKAQHKSDRSLLTISEI